MIAFCPCKINLGLFVTHKRLDGFHNIESIFYPVPFYDVLEMVEADRFGFQLLGHQVTADPEENLAVKAWRLLEKAYGLPPVQMALLKNIPAGAGLGGGSSNAAICLSMANELFALKLSTAQLKHYAALLGSDCPFFVEGQPAHATQKGETLKTLREKLRGYILMLVLPDIHIGTGLAYPHVKLADPGTPLEEVYHMPIGEWKGYLENSFEQYAFQLHPELKEIKNHLYDKGALYASMTGSGSAMYGIFDMPVKFDLPYHTKQVTL